MSDIHPGLWKVDQNWWIYVVGQLQEAKSILAQGDARRSCWAIAYAKLLNFRPELPEAVAKSCNSLDVVGHEP